MIPLDIHQRAQAVGCAASEEHGFCVLRRPGHSIAARGGTWDECFARLEAVEGPPRRSGLVELPATPPGHLF